jgi:hypothetical protein
VSTSCTAILGLFDAQKMHARGGIQSLTCITLTGMLHAARTCLPAAEPAYSDEERNADFINFWVTAYPGQRRWKYMSIAR